MARSVENRIEFGKGFSNRQFEQLLKALTFDGNLKGTIYKEHVLDAASVADAASQTNAVTVRGAALGDKVLVSCSVDQQDLTITGYVQAADTVEILIQNDSGGAVNLGSATYRILVLDMT